MAVLTTILNVLLSVLLGFIVGYLSFSLVAWVSVKLIRPVVVVDGVEPPVWRESSTKILARELGQPRVCQRSWPSSLALGIVLLIAS